MKKEQITIGVSGMHCANCALNLEKSLSNQQGIRFATVNFGTESATVEFDDNKKSVAVAVNTIRQSGFTVVDQKITLGVGGMHCASCALKVKESLIKVPGVIDATVNSATETALVNFVPDAVTLDDLKSAIVSSGYQYRGVLDDDFDPKKADRLRQKEQYSRLLRIIASFTLSIPMMILMYMPVHHMSLYPLIMFIISTPVFAYVSWPIFSAAIASLRQKNLSMDVMYALGIGTAYSASILGTFNIILTHEFMFYETALMLAGFLTLGRFLEARARGRTSESIKKLIGLQAKTATIIRDGIETEIPIKEVIPGHVIFVKPGEKIPVDGCIISGESTINEAMVTGESMPSGKKTGDKVIGGTINLTSVLNIKAEKVGKDTVLAQIIKLVREAQGSRPPIQKIADKAVTYFIPFVLSVAILTFLGWYFIGGASLIFSFTTFIAVLVIACPCALGLASPTAVTVGIGRGAELGLLIKNGDVLEAAPAVNAVVFDKTGTLTSGYPEVIQIVTINSSDREILSAAVSVERNSQHPIALAIIAAAEKAGIKPSESQQFSSIDGKGVSALVDGKRVLIGNRLVMIENGIDPYSVDKTVSDLENSGKTIVFVSIDKRLAGALVIADSLKKSSAHAVQALKNMNIDVIMMTGDNRKTAESIASQVGITSVLSEVLPQHKAAEVKKLQQNGKIVAFVGDGINDAPALSQADIGIAIGNGTDIAIESGDIVLVNGDPVYTVAAIQLGKKLISKIKWNLFWAFAYNTSLIPLAAGVLYPIWKITFKPEIAGFAMALSSVTVVSLSLLLKSYIPPVMRKS